MGKILQKALRAATKLQEVSHLYHKPEEYGRPVVYAFDKVQQERREGHPKYLGGHFRLWTPKPRHTMRVIGGNLIYDLP